MTSRRLFLRLAGLTVLGLAAVARRGGARLPARAARVGAAPETDRPTRTLFLSGDVMTGRGVDQILACPSGPRIHEPWARSALDYVKLAERAHGAIPRSVAADYIWGDALAQLRETPPDLRIINLETSVTTSPHWERKGINYRMHPANVSCLTAAGIDCCTLANNHVLDWGREGLVETLATLRGAGLATAGAGETAAEATAPAVLATRGPGRVLVWAWGSTTSGIPLAWGAGRERPGVALLPDLSAATARRLGAAIRRRRRPEDLVVVSIHWGGNWGYDVPDEQRELAHALIEEGEVDLVHGHSSHHAKGIEVFRGRPILYGCGDFVNDYEGIGGHERYRSELVLGYLVTMDSTTHRLVALEMLPFHRRRFRLTRAAPDEIRWLREVLDRESGALGAGVDAGSEGRLVLRWD